MLQGMIDFLISDNEDAQRMRDAFVWYIAPMVNPDGVYLGKSRGTSENRNANRDWMNGETVEINLIREHIILIDTTYGIDFFIDWHSQMDDTSWYNYVYSPPENTFFSILSAWTDFDTQFASTPGTGSENDCTARQYISWNIIYDPMFVFEPTPHLYTWTISSLRQQGVNVAYAINQYFPATPVTHTIVASAGVGGSIDPSGSVVVNHGEDQSFTITADTGYVIANVLVDGLPVGPVTGYSFTNVVADHTITASFAVETFTITVIQGTNGVISPGTTVVTYGATPSFTITPDTGYQIADVLVDGVSVRGDVVDGVYTFPAVTADHEITASFTQDQYTLFITIVGQGRVDVSPTGPYVYGTLVELTATADLGWSFSGWDGDLTGRTNPATITMDRSKSVTATFLQILLVDSNFDNSNDHADLRADGPGQDWYESRKDGVNGPTYLTLDESNVAGNTGKKAKITGTLSYNTYLSQQFNAQTGTFTVQFDIYYDALLNRASGEDRGAFICIGYEDPTGTNGPCSTGNERFVYLAIVKDGGAQTGPVALVWKNQAGTSTSIGNVNLDQWYTMKITVKVASNLYDVQVYDGSTLVLEKLNIPAATSGISPTHICFESWNDGAATFYVDNVFAPAELANQNPFTLIVLPDTQFYSQSYPAILTNQTQWIVNNVEDMNIVFVLHEGDIVNSDVTAQWLNANASMSLLDSHVPWAVLPGNHDGTDVGGLSEDLTNYNTYFSYSRFSGETWYGGAYNNINTNSFTLFSSGEDDYIIFNFQYYPSDAVLAWANETIAAYPNRRAIVVTHDYLNTDGTRTTEGNHIWNNFIIHHADQIFLVLCGHMHSEAKRQDTVNGHTIYQILADYQERTNGGNGWLRILEFHPAEDKIYIKTFSPYLNSYEIDADSQFTIYYDMTNPS